MAEAYGPLDKQPAIRPLELQTFLKVGEWGKLGTQSHETSPFSPYCPGPGGDQKSSPPTQILYPGMRQQRLPAAAARGRCELRSWGGAEALPASPLLSLQCCRLAALFLPAWDWG